MFGPILVDDGELLLADGVFDRNADETVEQIVLPLLTSERGRGWLLEWS
jgi:hypothetical protein